MKLESIQRNDNGDYYIIYSLPSPQKIHKNCKGKRELIIWGIPKAKFSAMTLDEILDGCDED